MALTQFLLIVLYSPQFAMSPKKDPEVSKNAVEEISILAGEAGPSRLSNQQDLSTLFSEFFKRQETQHLQLMKTIGDTSHASQNSLHTVVSAINKMICDPPQQAATAPACPSQQQVSGDLYTPIEQEDWEEVEDEGSYSNNEEEENEENDDTDNWDFPSSGKVSPPSQNAPPKVQTPSTAPETPVDAELFNMYGLASNWQLASELGTYLNSISDKEVPYSVLKSLNEAFVPQEEFQPFFTAPDLPVAISKLLYTAPKALSRGPKILNSSLLRVQRELCIAYKPVLEILNFFYSESYASLIEVLPQMKEIFTRQKLLLSQCLAIIISASLRVSKARKHALRPIIKFSSSGILQHQPTSKHVLGSSDLASLAEKANKENKALTGIFRHGGRGRGRYRAQFQPYNRNYSRNFQSSNNNYSRRYQNSYQGQGQYSRRYTRTKPRKGLATSSSTK